MKILIAGGGTGGHLFPGITIASEIKKRDLKSEILFVGSKKRIESTEVKKQGFNFVSIITFQMKKRFALVNIIFICSLLLGMVQSFFIVMKFRPDIILGLGGYISMAPVFTGYCLRISTVIHEQNFSPGRANKFLGRLVNKVAVSFESSLIFFKKEKGIFTGNFVRPQIRKEVSKEEGLDFLNLEDKRFSLLVVGGSRGAHGINQMMLGAIDFLKEELPKDSFQIIHLSGKEDESAVRKIYEEKGIKFFTASFLDRMEMAYSVADLVICRAGGTTITELVYCGLASIMIPYPFAVFDHQSENARFLRRHNASVVMPEKELSAEKLAKKIIYYVTFLK
ncbi:undecaprenyldiphospho-muramoylpentapeptide beta-N-acetylglucosaminyltransferase [Candidatus Auribacterota bacterium]